MDVEIQKPFPIQVAIELSDHAYWIKANLIEEWLVDNVGQYDHAWQVVYYLKLTNYYFQNAEDATMFSLKWTNT